MLDGNFNKKFQGNFSRMSNGKVTFTNRKFQGNFDKKFNWNFDGKFKPESARESWLVDFIYNLCPPRLSISPRLDDLDHTVNTTGQIMVSLN